MSLACYVLYLEHDNRPHEVWAFATREEAELFAVLVAHDIWIDCEGGNPETDEFPSANSCMKSYSRTTSTSGCTAAKTKSLSS